MANNRWNNRNDERWGERDGYRDDDDFYSSRDPRRDGGSAEGLGGYGPSGYNTANPGYGSRVGSQIGASPGRYQGLAGPGSFAAFGAPSSSGYPSQFGGPGGPPSTAWLGSSRHRTGHDEDRHAYDRSYQRAGEQRSFGGGNPFLENVTDGGSPGDDRGEHRGRGPRNYRRSDARILEDVNDRLTDDAWLDAQDIDVEVKDCEVTLNGTVPSRDGKRRAENLTERVSGVQHVQNNLRVRPRDQEEQLGVVLPVTE